MGFAAAVGAGLLGIALVIVSILKPESNVWPPPRVGSIQWIAVWGITITAFASIAVVGLRHWNAWELPGWIRWALGLPLVLSGNVLAWWGVGLMGVGNATGAMEGGLVRAGPYRFSRNPQYLGDLAILAGWVLLSASTSVLIAVIPATACFLLAPVPEERALRKKFGEEYERYREEVPRFL